MAPILDLVSCPTGLALFFGVKSAVYIFSGHWSTLSFGVKSAVYIFAENATHTLEHLASTIPSESRNSHRTSVLRPLMASIHASTRTTPGVGIGLRKSVINLPVRELRANDAPSLFRFMFNSGKTPIASSAKVMIMPPCNTPGYPLTSSPSASSVDTLLIGLAGSDTCDSSSGWKKHSRCRKVSSVPSVLLMNLSEPTMGLRHPEMKGMAGSFDVGSGRRRDAHQGIDVKKEFVWAYKSGGEAGGMRLSGGLRMRRTRWVSIASLGILSDMAELS